MQHANRLLGYPDDARLLIVNADDFGMCHAVNEAVIRALDAGLLRSATLMTPCPWALHAMRFLAAHPQVAFGVHLTAISEWANYRWGPLTPKEKVPSLLDPSGFFYTFDDMPALFARAKLAELEMEFRAQIDAVLMAGLRPTHLDWHALRIGGHDDIVDLMFGLAKEYGLALRVMGQRWIERVQRAGFPANDYDFLDSYGISPGDKTARYAQLLRELPAGLSEWAIHPGLDTPELLAIEPNGQGTRKADFDFLMSLVAQDLVRQEGIVLLDYRPLQAVWQTATLAHRRPSR